MNLCVRREPSDALLDTLTQLTILTPPTRPLHLGQCSKRVRQPRKIGLHIRRSHFRFRSRRRWIRVREE